MEVEVAGAFGFGVDEEVAAADLFAEGGCAGDDVLEEAGAESAPFVFEADAEGARSATGWGYIWQLPFGGGPGRHRS